MSAFQTALCREGKHTADFPFGAPACCWQANTAVCTAHPLANSILMSLRAHYELLERSCNDADLRMDPLSALLNSFYSISFIFSNFFHFIHFLSFQSRNLLSSGCLRRARPAEPLHECRRRAASGKHRARAAAAASDGLPRTVLAANRARLHRGCLLLPRLPWRPSALLHGARPLSICLHAGVSKGTGNLEPPAQLKGHQFNESQGAHRYGFSCCLS